LSRTEARDPDCLTSSRTCHDTRNPDDLTDRSQDAARRRPAESKRNGRSTRRTFTFPGCCMPFPSRRRSPAAEWEKSNTSHGGKDATVCARSFIEKTSERSSGQSRDPGFDGIIDEHRPPLEDEIIRYYGQISRSLWLTHLKAPKAAADGGRVTYARDKHNVDTHLEAEDEPDVIATHLRPGQARGKRTRGGESAFASAPVKIDQPMSRRPRRHIPSSCRRQLRSGMAQC